MHLHSLVVVCALAAMSTAPALAQSANSGTAHSPPAGDASKASVPNLQQTLKDDLSKAGFKDISVSPATFNVHATNSNGQKVFMLIGPESLTEIVSGQASGSAPSTTGTAPPSK